jgi:hypothetical protein
MEMDSTMSVLMLLGIAVGITYKSYVPYNSKKKEGTVQNFDPQYIWTAIVAFIGAIMSGMTMFPDAAQAWAEGWPFGTGYFAVFAFGFFWAVGWNYGANQMVKTNKK